VTTALDDQKGTRIDQRKDRVLPVFLNAFPLNIPDAELEALQVSYDKEALDGLRAKHGSTQSFRRQGDNILIFSADGTFPVSGTSQSIVLNENFGIF